LAKKEQDSVMQILKYLGVYWEWDDVKGYFDSPTGAVGPAAKKQKSSQIMIPLAAIIRPEILDVVKKSISAPADRSSALVSSKGVVDMGSLSTDEFQAAMRKYMRRVEQSKIPRGNKENQNA
jgi:hypothetical protein